MLFPLYSIFRASTSFEKEGVNQNFVPILEALLHCYSIFHNVLFWWLLAERIELFFVKTFHERDYRMYPFPCGLTNYIYFVLIFDGESGQQPTVHRGAYSISPPVILIGTGGQDRVAFRVSHYQCSVSKLEKYLSEKVA